MRMKESQGNVHVCVYIYVYVCMFAYCVACAEVQAEHRNIYLLLHSPPSFLSVIYYEQT